MRTNKLWLAVWLIFLAGSAIAHTPTLGGKIGSAPKKVQYRDVCANSEHQIDQSINNVRARLLGGGDCWWNNKDEGRYIVPKVDPTTGAKEVSSIFAGSVWIGGIDPGGNLKLACQTYRNDGKNDFWPGPLTDLGLAEQQTCKNWDQHFRVTGDDIRKHLANLAQGNLDPNDIPRNLRGWPARGNPFFVDVWGFELPNTIQGLGGFFDANEDQFYNPLDGDYPSIDIRGCPLDRYPDEMIFWIYNDHGGGQQHARTNGKTIQMEVQVQSFGYTTNDALNDMTFQRYKLINRATTLIDSCFFAMWVDPDLGCPFDDYVGCDTSKSLMFVYNQDATDGQPGCTCPSNDGPINTYCDNVPILGVDYFRGPLDADGNELGMSSFTYYNNVGTGNPPQGTTDPDGDVEYFRYITGSWKDGSPFTYGGNAKDGTVITKYAFTEAPNSPAPAWSMCTANLPFGDRRTLQASGPFLLTPGAVNELIIGVPWVSSANYPCPDLEGLFRADKLAQGLFDNCFDLLDGPDAPDVNWIEVNQEVIAVLTNQEDSKLSNNAKELYSELDPLAPDALKNLPEGQYRFEGYRIFQLLNPNVSTSDYGDPDKARIVAQVDIKNGAAKLYNWVETLDPNMPTRKIYYPELQVEGPNQGIKHTFSIKEDRFAQTNDKRLINHKKYYYTVIAYAYNEYEQFNPLAQPATGQQRTYLPGRKSATGPIQVFTVIPRPIVDQALRASYGDGVEITRLEGQGAGGNFLDITPETRAKLLNADYDSTVTYKSGRGPINVTIFNPFEVRDGNYELSIVDDNLSDTKLDITARWVLRNVETGEEVASQRRISELNEQIVAQYGFSVTVAQTDDAAGLVGNVQEGGIGAELEYADPGQAWLTGFPDTDFSPFNFVKTGKLEIDELLDRNQSLTKLGDGFFVPYYLADGRVENMGSATDNERLITPAWTERTGNFNTQAVWGTTSNRQARLNLLPNVDIVFTSDKSKWSRCVVIESASLYYSDNRWPKNPELLTESPSAAANRQRLMFDVRYAPSVGKDDTNGDGLPDPDGELEVAGAGIPAAQVGQPVRGMGWFPGYAVNVETGERLNVFFGENSAYSSAVNPLYTGRDMLFNPTATTFVGGGGPPDYYSLLMGGQHYVYVAYTRYDGCAELRKKFSPELNNFSASPKRLAIKELAWAGMIQMAPGFTMKPLKDGLIPSDLTVKLRVDNPFQTWSNNNDGNKFTGHPKYQFSINNKSAVRQLDELQVGNALDSVKCVPNPYYGYSQYENSQFSNVVKITNLPAKCTVTIYSLDGKFIRQYQRNEEYQPYQQITPALEWDLKNNKGIPVASGVYLVQLQAPGMGERTIKWFGIARQFDPSGL